MEGTTNVIFRWDLRDSKDSSNSNLKVRDLVNSLWEEVRVLHSTVEVSYLRYE